MSLFVVLLLLRFTFIECGAINLHINSAEDPLEGGEACGASGNYVTV